MLLSFLIISNVAAAEPAIVEKAYTDLTSPRPSIRRAAQIILMDLPLNRRSELQRLIQSQGVTVQQRLDLPMMARHIASKPAKVNPKAGAFLGMQSAGNYTVPGQPAAGVVVVCVPGFPAAQYLRDGDVLLGTFDEDEAAVGSKPFASFDDLTASISTRKPYQLLPLLVQRAGTVQRIRVPLTVRPSAEPEALDPMQVDTESLKAQANRIMGEEFAPLLQQFDEGRRNLAG